MKKHKNKHRVLTIRMSFIYDVSFKTKYINLITDIYKKVTQIIKNRPTDSMDLLEDFVQ